MDELLNNLKQLDIYDKDYVKKVSLITIEDTANNDLLEFFEKQSSMSKLCTLDSNNQSNEVLNDLSFKNLKAIRTTFGSNSFYNAICLNLYEDEFNCNVFRLICIRTFIKHEAMFRQIIELLFKEYTFEKILQKLADIEEWCDKYCLYAIALSRPIIVCSFYKHNDESEYTFVDAFRYSTKDLGTHIPFIIGYLLDENNSHGNYVCLLKNDIEDLVEIPVVHIENLLLYSKPKPVTNTLNKDQTKNKKKDSKQCFQISTDKIKFIESKCKGAPNEILINKFGYPITRKDIQDLYGKNWLDDSVLDFYLGMIEHGNNKVLCLGVFFSTSLLAHSYDTVRSWIKSIDYELIMVPVNVNGNHWCLAVINIETRCIKYYDSYHNSNEPFLNALRSFMLAKENDLGLSNVNRQ